MQRPGLLAAALVALIGVGGCGDDSVGHPAAEACDPFPGLAGLDVGSWWEYERTEWEEQRPDHVFAVTVTVMAVDSLPGGGIAYRLHSDAEDETFWLQATGCELRRYDKPPATARDHTVALRTPLEKGNRWQYSTISFGGLALYAEIVAVADTVIVPAGTFAECIHVRVDPYYDTWFNLAVGIVATAFTALDGSHGWRDELVDQGPEAGVRRGVGPGDGGQLGRDRRVSRSRERTGVRPAHRR